MLRSVSSCLSKIQTSFRPPGYRSLYAVQSLNRQAAVTGAIQTQFLHNQRLLHLTSSRYAETHEDIDRSLLRLDNEIRRTGRIARQEIDDILQDIRDMKRATSSQSLMIIRCCGELLPSETPENRTRMVEEIWKTMQNLNVPMDISHYNALLRVYLENEHKFNPTEFLQELTDKGIEPNRVTFQRLIARFCQEGDIDGASTILQHMKEKQLPINEHVFNALVRGHAQADDMQSAEGIIAVMKQTGLEPNDDTYVTLMCGYARKGDLGNINRIIQDCREKDVHLIDRDFLNIIYALATNDHEDMIPEIMKNFKKQTGFNQDITNFVLRLVNAGKPEVGYSLVKEMTRVIRNEELVPSGNFFIQQLVKSDTPSEKIIQYCKRMMDEDVNKYALSKACDIALQLQKFDTGTDLLEAFKESGAQMRQHYFWPLFAGSTTEKENYNGLKCMKYLGMIPNNETLRDYVIPSALKHGKKNASTEKTLEQLSSHSGIPLSTIVPAAMQHLLMNEKNLSEATRFAAKYRLRFTNPQTRRAVLDSYFREKNAKLFVEIVGSSSLDGEDQGRETMGIMLLELLESCRPKEKSRTILPILKEMLTHGMGLSNSGSELIQNNLGEDLSPEIANLLVQLTSGDLTPNLEHYQMQARSSATSNIALDEKSIPELEQLHEEAIKANKPTRSLKKALLFAYCRKRELEKADSIRQDLISDGFIFPTGLQALLLELYSSFNKIEEAKTIYKGLMDSLENSIDDVKFLRYAQALFSSDLVEDGIEVLKNTPRDETRKASGVLQQTVVWNILNHFADKGQVENVKQVFEILQGRNLLHVNNVTLGPLVKAYLVKDDLEGALAEFEKCVKHHHATPWKQELFCRFIKTEDTDRLQKVIDLSTTLHGEVNSMYDLVFAFIQCGKLRQAKKILETPGLRARNDKIELTCQKYLQEDRIEELENLIQITKDVINIDRNSMYFYLLQSYCKVGDADKAMSVWTSLQEENVQPSSDLLSYLADFLRKNNKPIPFVEPQEKEIDLVTPSSKSSNIGTSTTTNTTSTKPASLTTKFRQSLEANEIDTALQLKQRLSGSNTTEKLSLHDLSSLIEKMTRAERLGEATRLTEELMEKGSHPFPRVLRLLLGRLANAGNIEALIKFENLLSPDLKRYTTFNTRLCVAYVNANRAKEYFETYIRKPVDNLSESAGDENILSIPLSGSTYILTRNEDLLGEYEKLAVEAEQKGNVSLYNSLWSFHLIKRNFDKARDIWEAKLKRESRITYRSVVVESKLRNDDISAKELASQIMTSETLPSAAKGSACSNVIDVLCSQEKVDEAFTYLQTSLEKIKIEDFNSNALRLLKTKLEDAGKTFPYKLPRPTRDLQRGKKSFEKEDD